MEKHGKTWKKTLLFWLIIGFTSHATVWLIFFNTKDRSSYVTLFPILLGLPLSISTNIGKKYSTKIKRWLAIDGNISAEKLTRKAQSSGNIELSLLAKKYWAWQSISTFLAGAFFFWFFLLIQNIATNTKY